MHEYVARINCFTEINDPCICCVQFMKAIGIIPLIITSIILLTIIARFFFFRSIGNGAKLLVIAEKTSVVSVYGIQKFESVRKDLNLETTVDQI